YPLVKKLFLIAPAFKYLVFIKEKFDIIESIKLTPKIFKDYTYDEIISRILKTSLSTAKEFANLTKKHQYDPSNITIPTLIIRGNNDKIVPLDSVEHVYKTLNSNTKILIKYDNVTHDAFKGERTEELVKTITLFLKHTPKNKIEIIKK
ncbi:MAG: alpha/beta hydrolase, partial [bacterium]|nr:alpha/beta hydrolase [bacterium]